MMSKYNAQDFGKVVVLMGGYSLERNTSLASGKNVLDALKRCGVDAHGLDVQDDVASRLIAMKPNYAFIALHGSGGEDGSIQGLLQYLGIPYTGTGVAGSAIASEKTFAKLIWQSVGLPTLQFRLVADIESAIEVMQDHGLPLCVKPTNAGSSIGVSKVTEPEQLPDAFSLASKMGDNVMIEPWIEGTEYTIGILGNAALPVVEMPTSRLFYNDEANYQEDSTNLICPCNLGPEKEQQLQDLAVRAFQITGCSGWGRVDVVKDRLGNFWLLEINTIPDLTERSLVAKAAQALGISFDQLVISILGLAHTAEKSL